MPTAALDEPTTAPPNAPVVQPANLPIAKPDVAVVPVKIFAVPAASPTARVAADAVLIDLYTIAMVLVCVKAAFTCLLSLFPVTHQAAKCSQLLNTRL